LEINVARCQWLVVDAVAMEIFPNGFPLFGVVILIMTTFLPDRQLNQQHYYRRWPVHMPNDVQQHGKARDPVVVVDGVCTFPGLTRE
jgi:hypothetical protein